MSAETIFISIAAYSDPMLAFTINSARSQASDPSRIYFGVVDQSPLGQALRMEDQWALEHVRWTRVDALEARGPCWARALAMALHQDEDWFLQVDSHTWFEPGWDERLLHWARRCGATNPRTLITCYPNPFVMRNGHPAAESVTNKVLAMVVRGDSEFAADNPVLMFEGVAVESDEPIPGVHLAGGCLFAPASMVDELPYDPHLYFHGEEQSLSLRAYTRGWDIVHIPGMPMYHLYTIPGSQPRPMHWSPEHDERRAVRSARLEAESRKRLSALIWEGADLGAYGLGSQRSLADYAAFSGIDFAARRIEDRARKARFGY
jgi:Glycosyltransferase (GlcNAc)